MVLSLGRHSVCTSSAQGLHKVHAMRCDSTASFFRDDAMRSDAIWASDAMRFHASAMRSDTLGIRMRCDTQDTIGIRLLCDAIRYDSDAMRCDDAIAFWLERFESFQTYRFLLLLCLLFDGFVATGNFHCPTACQSVGDSVSVSFLAMLCNISGLHVFCSCFLCL